MGKRRNPSRWGCVKRWSIGVTSRYCWYALILICVWAILQPALLSHARDVHARYANHTRHANHTKSYERSCDDVSTVDAFVDMPDGITGKWKTLGGELHVSWNRIEVIDLEQYSPERKRQAVLRAWYEDREEPYWEEVVEALKRVDRKRLANLIRGCKGKRRHQLVSCGKDDGDRHADDPSTDETAASHDESTSRKDEFGNDSHSNCQGSSSTRSSSASDVSCDEVGDGSHSTSQNTSVETTSSTATKNGLGDGDHSNSHTTSVETTSSTATKNGLGDSDHSNSHTTSVETTSSTATKNGLGDSDHSNSHTTSGETTSSSATKNGLGNSDNSTNQETDSTTASAAKDDVSGGSDLASGDTNTLPDTTSGSLNSAHGTTSNDTTEIPEHSAPEWKEISDIVNVLLYMLEAVKQEQHGQSGDGQERSCSQLTCYKPPLSSGLKTLSSTSQELVSGQQAVNNLFLFLRNHKDLHIHVSLDSQQMVVAVQSCNIQQPDLVVDECSFALHCLCLLLLLGGDIERNPGPPKSQGGSKRKLEESNANEVESPGPSKTKKLALNGGAEERKRKIDRTDNVESAGGPLKKPRHSEGETPRLGDALRILLPVANDWQIIGTLMHITPDVLANIRTTEKEVPIQCLRAMLEKAFVLIDPPLTWKAIAEAVEPINPAKAKEIRDTYCGVEASGSPVESSNQSDVGTAAVPRTDEQLIPSSWMNYMLSSVELGEPLDISEHLSPYILKKAKHDGQECVAIHYAPVDSETANESKCIRLFDVLFRNTANGIHVLGIYRSPDSKYPILVVENLEPLTLYCSRAYPLSEEKQISLLLDVAKSVSKYDCIPDKVVEVKTLFVTVSTHSVQAKWLPLLGFSQNESQHNASMALQWILNVACLLHCNKPQDTATLPHSHVLKPVIKKWLNPPTKLTTVIEELELFLQLGQLLVAAGENQGQFIPTTWLKYILSNVEFLEPFDISSKTSCVTPCILNRDEHNEQHCLAIHFVPSELEMTTDRYYVEFLQACFKNAANRHCVDVVGVCVTANSRFPAIVVEDLKLLSSYCSEARPISEANQIIFLLDIAKSVSEFDSTHAKVVELNSVFVKATAEPVHMKWCPILEYSCFPQNDGQHITKIGLQWIVDVVNLLNQPQQSGKDLCLPRNHVLKDIVEKCLMNPQSGMTILMKELGRFLVFIDPEQCSDGEYAASGKVFDIEGETRETRKIMQDFGVLLTKVHHQLENANVQVKRFVFFLKRQAVAFPDRKHSLFQDELCSLERMSDLTDVFDTVVHYCSWYNHHLLSRIIEAFSLDGEAYTKYCRDFREYCRHRICKLNIRRNGLGSGDGHKEPIMIKIDKHWNTVRMEELEDVNCICAKILKVERPTLHLRSFEDGCVELHYLVPKFVADVIFPLTLLQEAALAEAEVIWLCTKYYTFLLDEYLQFCKLKGSLTKKESTELFSCNRKWTVWAASTLWIRYFSHPMVVRVKEPPSLRYTGPLATARYRKIETKFTTLYLSLQFDRIQNLAQKIDRSTFSVDVRVIALCWSALAEIALQKQFEHGEELLRTALEHASKLECENCLLLQGRVLRLLAHMHYIKVFTVPVPSSNTEYAELEKNTNSKDELDLDSETDLEEEADITQYFDDEALQTAFKEAMKKGYVKCRMVLLLLIGAAGGGKTHVKNMLFNEPPPPIRQSTPLAEAPIRSIAVLQAISSPTTLEWRRVTLAEVKTMVAEAVCGSEVPLADIEHPLSPPFLGTDTVHTYESVLPQTTTPLPNVFKQDPVSGSDSPIHPQSNPAEKPHQTAMDESTDLSQQVELTDLSDDHTSSDVLSKSTAETFTPQKTVLDTANLTEDFVALINQSTGSRKLLEVDWVYVVDSGGQPQFSEILPVFIRNASAIAFVLKLNEQLGNRPTIEYYDKNGWKLGSSYTSALTNEQILIYYSQVIRSRQCMSSEAKSPKLFIVGTHNDLKNTCSESVNEKNQRLQDVLLSLHDNLASYNSNSILYPVNAKTPSAEDKLVTDVLRREIMKVCKDERQIPLPWFVYEQFVQQVAQDKGVSLLSTKECKAIAQELHMNEDAFNAALRYFSDLKLLLYYPQLLPNVVFCNSQVVLDKISELVEFRYRLEAMENVSGEWLQLRDYGIFRIEFLAHFDKHYVNGLFTPGDLLHLLNGLLITFPINNNECVMPCLLPRLSPDEMDNHCQLDLASPATPLLIKYPDQVIPSGIFILLVAFLKKSLDWSLLMDVSSGRPLCLYRNCVKFNLSTVEGKITLMDSFNYLGVRLDAPPGVCQTVCFEIYTFIIMGLEKAADTLGYQNLKPQTGFQVAGDEWISSVDDELTEQQKLWFHPTKESAEELEPSFHDYCKCVRKSYQMRSPVRTEHNTWPPVKQTKFINLTLLKSEKLVYGYEYSTYTIRGSADDILAGMKEEITYTELFGSAEAGARILVEGRSGSGKTTLVNKVSQDWAANSIMKDISLLLLVPLHRFHNKQVIHLSDIIRLFDPEGLKLSVATGISASGGQGVCIVLDGIDEYSYHDSLNNFITELMLGNLLPNAVVIATSRPAAAHHLRKYASKRAEVLGFLRHQINRYVIECYSSSKDKAITLLQYLEHHPNIRHMCYLPLHLAMIIYVNDVLEGKHEALPKTETEVYMQFTTYTLLRDLNRYPTIVISPKLKTPKELPRELFELFKNICRLAFEVTVESERIFSKERVGDIFGDRIEIASLGLVTVDKQFIQSGLEETYSFLHLTFQEFLAAYYITGLPDVDQVRLCREQCEHKHMNVVMKFYCGLTKLNGDAPAEVFRTMIGHSNANLLYLLQCTCESQNSKSCCDLISSRDGTLALCDESITPSDCVALAFCINSTSTVLTKIELSSCHLDEKEYEVLSSEITGNCAHVKCICLNRTLVRKKAVRCLIQFLHKFPNLQSLEMAKCMSKVHSLKELSSLLEGFTSLTHLSIDVVIVKSAHEVFGAVKSLQSLRINGRVLATEITKEAEGSTTVKLLHLKKTSEKVLVTGDSTLSILSVMLHDVLSESDMAAVVELMKVCSATLRTIQFDFLKGINAKVAAALGEGLKVCTTLQELNLGENRLGDEGLISLCEGLKLCTCLQILHLQGNNSTDGSIESLAYLLRTLKCLTYLDVKSNNFTEGGKAVLRQAVEERKEMEGFADVELLV